MTDDDNAKIVEDLLGEWGWTEQELNVEEVEDKHFYVIGLDPGETTGVAILRIDTEDQKKLPEVIFLDQVPEGHVGFYDYFASYFLGDNVQVVSEKWVEFGVKGANHEPLLVEGVEHALWRKWNIAWQTPDMKAAVSDDWLREQDVWTEGKRHQMDALIHAIVYLRNDGHEGTIAGLGGRGEGSMGDPQQGDGENPGDGIDASLAQLARDIADGTGVGAGSEDNSPPEGEHAATVEPQGQRKERDLDGAFIGYVSEEEGSDEVSLLDD